MPYTVKDNWLDTDTTKETMIEIMEACRVFSIEKEGCCFEVIEGCDDYFGVLLTKEQMLALADEIRDLANSV